MIDNNSQEHAQLDVHAQENPQQWLTEYCGYRKELYPSDLTQQGGTWCWAAEKFQVNPYNLPMEELIQVNRTAPKATT
jgi:hypothetical protein